MPFQTLVLPAGVEQSTIITIPRNGDWSGLTRIRATTYGVNAVIHSLEFIDCSQNDNRTRYRRVGYKRANNWYNFALVKDQEFYWWARGKESLVKMTYTATNPIWFIYETAKYGWIDPADPLPAFSWNKYADAKPWVTNLAANNPTEYRIIDPFPARDNLGVTYWRPRV
jgi:hypothetical protein